jgi:hypothetical protein
MGLWGQPGSLISQRGVAEVLLVSIECDVLALTELAFPSTVEHRHAQARSIIPTSGASFESPTILNRSNEGFNHLSFDRVAIELV